MLQATGIGRVVRWYSALQGERGKLAAWSSVLGSVGIADRDQLLPVGGGQPRRLLGLLLAYRNTVVSADRLVDILWAEPPAGAAATLQSYVSKLRRFVELAGDEVRLVSRAPGYVLEVPDDLVDAGRFERGLTEARAALELDPRRALDCLESALAEWRGAAFAEFADAEWIRPEAIRLEELRVAAEEVRADAELRLGHHDQVVGRLEALVAVHPLREHLWMQLMLGLFRAGRQTEALRCARSFRSRMRDELGLEPTPAMRELETAILEARAEIFETLGNDAVAATLYGALDAAGVMRALPLEPGNADEFARAVERLSARLGNGTFTENADRGRGMRDEEVVRYALDEIDRLADPGSA